MAIFVGFLAVKGDVVRVFKEGTVLKFLTEVRKLLLEMDWTGLKLAVKPS